MPPIEIWDHHPEDSSDIEGAVVREAEVGANTTLLAGEAMRRGCTLRTEDATIALTGIYADTGNFTHESVRSADFEAAAWLISQGASLPLVKSFLRTLTEESQITLFHELLNRLSYQTVHGHLVLTVYREMDRQVGGLAAVVEKVFEVESPDALFAVFAFTRDNETLIIARSQAPGLDVSRLLRAFGGGGHAQASSALLKGEPGRKTFHALQACLKTMLADAVSAAAIMERRVETIRHDWTLLNASRFLEDSDRSGMPVIDPEGKTLRLPEPERHHEGAAWRADDGAGELSHGEARGVRFPRLVAAGDRDPLLHALDLRSSDRGRGSDRGHRHAGRVPAGPCGPRAYLTCSKSWTHTQAGRGPAGKELTLDE